MIHWRSCKWALSEHKPHTHLFMCSKSITWERNEDRHTLHCEQLLADDQMQVHPSPNCIGASDIPYLLGKPPSCPYWWMQHHPTTNMYCFFSHMTNPFLSLLKLTKQNFVKWATALLQCQFTKCVCKRWWWCMEEDKEEKEKEKCAAEGGEEFRVQKEKKFT